MTATTTQLSRIWQPLQIGPMRLKNRVIVPARVMNWSKTGVLSDRHLDHYRELVAGGAAMIVTEQHAAYPVAKGSFHNPCSAWDPRAVPQFEEFARIVHEHDARGVVELFGTGVHDKGMMLVDDWKPLWGVSDIPSVVHTEVPTVIGKNEIEQIVAGFVQSARNVRDGGLDGVEIHAAHGYLLCQFLSTIYNKRTDEYGGPLENRARIVVDIARGIRADIGSDLAVGLRLSYDEYVDGAGITPDEADRLTTLFVETGLFDYFSISAGSYHTIHRSVAPMQEDDGHLVPLARRAKRIVADRAAVFAVGKVRDLHLAEEIVASGAADVVALGRAQLADPHIVRKTREGREHEIIRCTNVNECVGRLFDETEVICMMNPVTGREGRWSGSEPAADVKSVLVVGGGPAGLKLASVAAGRGHLVTLVEEREELGGHLNLLASMPRQPGWGVAVDDLVRAVRNAGVDVRLGTRADAGFVRRFGADEVYLAVGAYYDDRGVSVWSPHLDEVPGVRAPHVIGVDEAVRRVLSEGGGALGSHVIIVDESGTYLPLGLAELVAESGAIASIVTPQMFVGSEVERHLGLPWAMPRLRNLGVEFVAQKRLEAIEGGSVVLSDRWSEKQEVVEGVSTVVLSVYRRSHTDLADQLADLGDRVQRVGDALAPRKLAELIYEGELLGRRI
ncbi:FAD-dependent oxidoreductase [Spirillospora sp. NPDC047279]|uniref:oxidoreductase n=1 Tax=Spirillospora sp. NPDC047279 TaxID=3155478 RepID=UPI00340EA965